MKRISHIGIYVAPGSRATAAARNAFLLAETCHARVTFLGVGATRSHSSEAAKFHTLAEASADALRAAITRLSIDLLVKQAQPTPGSGRVVGGIARDLLRDCPCPLWIVRSVEDAEISPVIAAVGVLEDDGGEETALARQVISTAAFLAAHRKRPLVVAHAWSAVGDSVASRLERRTQQLYVLEHRRWLYGKLARLVAETTAIPARIELVHGQPAKSITELAATLGSETIVVGHGGRSGFRAALFGNTGEEVIDATHSNVLSIPAV